MAHIYRRYFAHDPNHPEYTPPQYHPKYPREDPTDAYRLYFQTMTRAKLVNFFQGQLFSCILEDIIQKMGILMNTKNDYHVTKLLSEMDKHRAKKYNVGETKVGTDEDELENVDPKDLDNMMYKLNKLDDDRKYFVNVISTLYIEIYMDRRFKSIVNSVKDVIREEQYRIDLKEEELLHKQQRREIYKQLRQQRNHIKTVVYDSNITIEDLKNKLEDLELTESIRGRYIDNWEQARTEQNTQFILEKENVHTNISEYFKMRSEQEARVHVDIEMLINIQINETLKQVEEWMNKYESHLEGMDLKLQLKKMYYQEAKDKHQQLDLIIEQHAKEMDAWVSFKEERERIRIYREKMMNSAITVQSWWRGMLVRRMLGPYKVRKGKKALKTSKF